MKKIILTFILISTYIFSNINVVVSIVPQQTFLKAIGGDKVNSIVMVQAGDSPHAYEPKPSQMLWVGKADLYLAIDVEFEDVWLGKFKNQNTHMQIVDITKGIEKIHMVEKCAHGHEAHTHAHEGTDPHIWTSPHNVKRIAQNIYDALASYDPSNIKYYKNNLKRFLSSIEETNKQIVQILSTLKDSRSFMVFHPSWGYFAKAYDLKQIAVEVEGKSPKPRALIQLIKEAKKEKVNAIFTQPEFSDSSAKIIAKALHIPVVKISPMAADWSPNLIVMAKTIAGQK